MNSSAAKTEVKTKKAVSNLRLMVREYESDTFSADASGLKEYELDQIVAELINHIEDHLDGVILSSLLEEVRE